MRCDGVRGRRMVGGSKRRIRCVGVIGNEVGEGVEGDWRAARRGAIWSYASDLCHVYVSRQSTGRRRRQAAAESHAPPTLTLAP